MKAAAPAKRKAKEESDSDDESPKPAKKRASAANSVTAAKRKNTKIESEDEDDDNPRKNEQDDHDADLGPLDDEEMKDIKPKKAAPAKKAPPVKVTPAKVKPAASKGKGKAVKAEDDQEAEEPKKFKWTGPKVRDGPINPGQCGSGTHRLALMVFEGAKEIPEGVPDCLGGLTLVFTGELETIGRDEASSLAKRYGAKVTTSVSSKTSFVILGSEAGPKKLEMIKKNKIKTLNEDEFLNLIATRGAKDKDEKYVKKQKEDEKKIRAAAKAIKIDPDFTVQQNALWTVKYAPTNIKELCGNPGPVGKLQEWLEAWPKLLKKGFKQPGKDGWGTFRAVLISGPPGIGKTTSAHLIAKLAGYNIIEMNASDTRSKKLLEAQLRSSIDNSVLDGYVFGKKSENAAGDNLSDRSVLIMDEVDGTSAGDRGGIGALNALIKKTKIPIICIANDIGIQKMKPLINTTFQLKFRRPDANSIRSRLMTISFREGLKLDKTAVDQLVSGTQSDIRQIINILATWKLSNASLSFDETRTLTEQRDSNSLLTPFALMDKLFGPYAWSTSAKPKLQDKLDVYFQEFDMLPLWVQENYLKHKYARTSSMGGRDQAMKKMEYTSKAADCIADADLLERQIRGGNQQWSLLPVHGMMSTVMPSYYCYGQGGYGNYGNNDGGMGSARAFPSWFGKNSTQGRLQRLLTDIQIRMRLKVSGDRREIRQSYIPTLFHKLVTPLVEEANEGIEEVIEQMDNYYLSKDEWDALVELGIGENAGEPILKKIKPATKTAFTRKYNATDHPIPFHKGTDIQVSKRVAGESAKPDLEEAFEVEPEPEPEEDEKKKKKDGSDEDTIKDKLVKAKKPKAASKKASATATKAAPKAKTAKS